MKKFLFAVALAVGALSTFAAGEYVARGISFKAFNIDGHNQPVDGVVTLESSKTVAPYSIQVLKATKGQASTVVTGVTTNFVVVDKVDKPTYNLIYTNGAAKVTNTVTRLDPIVIGTLKPSGYTLNSTVTNHVYSYVTNTVANVADPSAHFSVTTNTVNKTATQYTGVPDTGKIELFGVENINGVITTNAYLASTSLSSGKLAATSCYQAATPLFTGNKLHVKATTADKVLVKIVYLTFGK